MSSEAAEPLLSVVIPAFNVEMWIDETLRSILSQGIEEMEVIVVDDGSTDGTSDALRAWQDADARVVVRESGGVGGGSARNLGVAEARGRYLLFSDADDIVPRGAYRTLVDQLDRTGSDIVAGRFLKFSSSRTWDPTQNWPVYKALVERTTLREAPALIRGRAVWNKMFRRDFWMSHGLVFPDVPRSNDIYPMTAAMNRADAIDIVPDVVYLYRERPGGRSMTAQAAAYTGVRSYLDQELRCAQELRLDGDNPISRTYGRLLLEADLWVHVMRFVASQKNALQAGVSAADAAELADTVARLIESVPRAHRPKLKPEQNAVYDLVTAGSLGSLSGLNEKAGVGGPETLGDIDIARSDAAAARRLATLHHGFAHIPSEFVRERVLAPLTRLLDEDDLGNARRWADFASGPEVTQLTEGASLTQAERSLLNLNGSDDRIAIVASMRAAGSVVVELEKGRNRFRVSVPSSVHAGSASIGMRHRDLGERHELLANLTPGESRDVAVTGADLPKDGVWQLEVRLQSGDLVVDLPGVVRDVTDAWPVKRWHRTVTSPVVRAGNQLVVVRRPGLPSRLAAKATTALRRRIGSALGR